MKVYSGFLDRIDGMDNVSLFFDEYVPHVKYSNTPVNVAYALEPVDVIGIDVQKYLLANSDKFDLILTDQAPLLHLSNAVLFPFGTAWVQNYKENKEFSVSTVIGNKTQTRGHILRHVLHAKMHQITIPTKFYGSSKGSPKLDLKLVDTKEPLFDSMFHIVIENSFSDHYFSEKLIDCLVSKTVPIYMGAKKIGNYFNTDSIIQANSITEIIKACNKLKPCDYTNMLGSINENFTEAQKYRDWHGRIKRQIERSL